MKHYEMMKYHKMMKHCKIIKHKMMKHKTKNKKLEILLNN